MIITDDVIAEAAAQSPLGVRRWPSREEVDRWRRPYELPEWMRKEVEHE